MRWKTLKFSISKSALLDSLSVVSKGMSGRSTLPILSGVYVSAHGGTITFQATDLEISVKHNVEALIEEEGEAVVSGKLFNEIVRSLPEASIECSTVGELFNIHCMNSVFNISTMDPKDFPAFPNVTTIESISLPAAQVSKMVKKVSKALSKDQYHVILTGIDLTIEDGILSMVATDSHKLALAKFKLDSYDGQFSLIVPGATFDDICKLITKEEKIEIGYSENQIVFSFGDSQFVTRKLEGNYPNYKQIIPTQKTVTALVDNKTFIESVKRVSIVSQENMMVGLILSPDSQQITIFSENGSVRGAEEKIDAQIDGEEILIGFNYQNIIDGLTSVDTEEVIFEANQPLKPGVIKTVGNDDFLYLAMPIRLNN